MEKWMVFFLHGEMSVEQQIINMTRIFNILRF